jgi:hypothetical protein
MKFIKYTLFYFLRANKTNDKGMIFNFLRFNFVSLMYQDFKQYFLTKTN